MLIELFNLLCAIGLAVSGSLTFWQVNAWYEFYIPIVLFIGGWLGGFAIMWIIYWIVGLITSKKKVTNKPSKWCFFWFNNAVWFICFHAGCKLKIKGANKLPKKQRFLLVGNHRSKFDPMLVAAKFNKLGISFITKQDNLKVPLAKYFMPGMCYMGIDREDKLQSLDVMKKSIELISSGAGSVGVYPEGKRNYGIDLGEFHEGVFNIAIHAHCPIVVVTMRGTEQIKKRFPRRTTVYMNIERVIPYEEIEGQTAISVSNMVHEIMLSTLSKK